MLNENVWGYAPYPDAEYQPTTENNPLTNIRIKKVKTDAQTMVSQLQTFVANDILQYGIDIDKSISWSAVGKEHPLCDMHYCVKNTSENTFNIVDEPERSFFNWTLAEKTNNAITDRQHGCLYLGNESGRMWQTTTDIYNCHRYLEPYATFNVKLQVMTIMVICSDNLNYDYGHIFDLKTYCTNEFVNYPYVHSVYGEFSVGYNTPRGGSAWIRPQENRSAYIFMQLEPLHYNNETYLNYLLTWDSVNAKNFMPIMGAMSQTKTQDYGVDMLPIFIGDKTIWNCHYINSNTACIYREIDNTNVAVFRADCMKSAACYGLYFTDDLDVAINGSFIDVDMCIGILDNNGIGHGEYYTGFDTIRAAQNQWIDMHDSGYNPATYDPTNYTNDTHLAYTVYGNAFTKSYIITENDVNLLARQLYTASLTTQQGQNIQERSYELYLTSNPIDCIVSLCKFPVDNIPSIGVPTNIVLGTYETTVTGLPLLTQTYGYDFIFDTSRYNTLYPKNNGDFRDYEPYTKVSITIPFCGTVEIPTTYIYEYDDVRVTLIIDFITGTCTGIVRVNDIVITSASGSCGLQMPVSGIQSATLDAQLNQIALREQQSNTKFALSVVGGLLTIGAAALTGGISAYAMAGAGALGIGFAASQQATTQSQIDYDLSHMQTPIKSTSSSSAAIAQTIDCSRCKMIISRPVTDPNYNAEIYGRTTGFACLINTTVENMSGLTVGNIVLNDCDATETEKEMIKNLFIKGVVV